MQEGQPVASSGKKLYNAQCNYSTENKKLLSIVMTLCEFWSILLGAAHTHQLQKHLTYWRLLTMQTAMDLLC